MSELQGRRLGSHLLGRNSELVSKSVRRCFRLDSKQSAVDFQECRFDVGLRMTHLPNLAIQDRGRVGHRLRNEFADGGL